MEYAIKLFHRLEAVYRVNLISPVISSLISACDCSSRIVCVHSCLHSSHMCSVIIQACAAHGNSKVRYGHFSMGGYGLGDFEVQMFKFGHQT